MSPLVSNQGRARLRARGLLREALLLALHVGRNGCVNQPAVQVIEIILVYEFFCSF